MLGQAVAKYLTEAELDVSCNLSLTFNLKLFCSQQFYRQIRKF